MATVPHLLLKRLNEACQFLHVLSLRPDDTCELSDCRLVRRGLPFDRDEQHGEDDHGDAERADDDVDAAGLHMRDDGASGHRVWLPA